MLHEYATEKLVEDRLREAQHRLQAERWRREALQQRPRPVTRLRIAVGKKLLQLGAALVGQQTRDSGVGEQCATEGV